jgi:hypothetical protein
MMKVYGFAAAAALAAATVLAPGAGHAADAPERVYRERVYERPVPRVYYQSARPTAVCRVAFLREDGRGWPKEQRRVARCTSFH